MSFIRSVSVLRRASPALSLSLSGSRGLLSPARPLSLSPSLSLSLSGSRSLSTGWMNTMEKVLDKSLFSPAIYPGGEPEGPEDTVPSAMKVFGAAGLLPFALGPLGALIAPSVVTASMLSAPTLWGLCVHSANTYGVAILSFLGGIQFGVAAAGFHAKERAPETSPALPNTDDDDSTQRSDSPLDSALSLQVLSSGLAPAWAWYCKSVYYVDAPSSLSLSLALGFAAQLWMDHRFHRMGLMPKWYLRLRWPLTLTVCGLLLTTSALVPNVQI